MPNISHKHIGTCATEQTVLFYVIYRSILQLNGETVQHATLEEEEQMCPVYSGGPRI